MNKQVLIQETAARTAVPTETVGQVLDAILETITETNLRGERVILMGFGTFTAREMPERNVTNPQTGQPMVTRAHYRPVFRPGRALRRRVREMPVVRPF